MQNHGALPPIFRPESQILATKGKPPGSTIVQRCGTLKRFCKASRRENKASKVTLLAFETSDIPAVLSFLRGTRSGGSDTCCGEAVERAMK
jgi:hypothetical protein